MLARGAHAVVTDLNADGCRVALEEAGEYLVVPFTDGSGPDAAPRAALSVQPPVPFTGAALRHVAVRDHAPPLATIADDAAAASHVVLGSTLGQASVAAAAHVRSTCLAPAEHGAAWAIRTARRGAGVWRVGDAAAGVSGTAVEAWRVVGRTPSLLLLADGPYAAALAASPARQRALAALVADADTAAVRPVFGTHLGPVPVSSALGRTIVLLAEHVSGAAGLAFVGMHVADGCRDAQASAVLVEAPREGMASVGTALSVLVHELAHVHDLLGRSTVGPPWIVEGFAVFAEHLWVTRSHGREAATANVTHPGAAPWHGDTVTIAPCAATDRWSLRRMRTGWSPDVYRIGCAAMAYAWGHALREGRAPAAVADAWRARADVPDAADLALPLRILTGDRRDRRVSLGEWLLSWYADDFVPGVATRLTTVTTNWRAALDARDPLGFALSQGVPALRLTAGHAWRIDAPLDALDAVYLLAEVLPNSRLRVEGATGSTSVAILRVR